MKFFLIISIIIFNVIYSSTSFAELKNVAGNSSNTYYIETKSIKKSNGYIYYWVVNDYTKPDKFGDLSSQNLYETDCKVPLKMKRLAGMFYNGPMATNETTTTLNAAQIEMQTDLYAPPGSISELLIDFVCNY